MILNTFQKDEKEKSGITTLYTQQSEFLRYVYIITNKEKYHGELLKIIINPSKILNKKEFTNDDLEPFLKGYYKIINKVFSYETLQTEFFSRIDYYLDIVFANPKIKKLILKIYNKLLKKYRGLKKNTRYKSSIYYNSKSSQINIYSRIEKILCIKLQSFRNKKKVDVKKELYPFISEKDQNTIRYEVQIKRKKIWYHLKHDGTSQELLNYWNYKDAAFYINKVLKSIIYSGNYYNSHHAGKILKKLFGSEKANILLEFQKYMSLHGADAAKIKYGKKYNKYVNKLQNKGINPFLIPYNEGLTYLENPIKFKAENIYQIPDDKWTGLLSDYIDDEDLNNFNI